ncbi:hypothetical protein [Streptomyces sp. NPDC001292]|uniref:hypothetical protein n=1 Tax=Streptomyces sp. NPDC001292 TaxID=3364558 RepID=UPI0036B5388C
MMEADPPEHTRLCWLASAAFTPHRTAELAPRIEQIAHDLIDALPPAGEVDLVAAKRRASGDDLLSALVAVRDEEDGRLC